MRNGTTPCNGVPPLSCSAFGDSVVSLTNPGVCVDCSGSGPLLLVILVSSFVVATAIALALSVRLGLRKPHVLKQRVSTVIILFNHAQTLAIISGMRLAWPRALEVVIHMLGLNFLRLPALSCFLNDGGSSLGYFVYHFAAIATAIGLPLLALLYLIVVRCCRDKDRTDSAELVVSFLFAVFFTFSWN